MARIELSHVIVVEQLVLLAPEIVEAILGGSADQRVMLEKLGRPLPMGWEEQRSAIGPINSVMADG